MTHLDYRAEFFEVADLEEAKLKILTPENGVSTAERWQRETLPMTDLLIENLNPSVGQTLIDYGCGIGRLAKELIKQSDCHVIGVDISRSMRAMSQMYCETNSFFSCSNESLRSLMNCGFRADHAFSVWVLQHAENPGEDINLIYETLASDGTFLVINLDDRCLPTRQGWQTDGIDIKKLIEKRFEVVKYFPPPEGALTDLARLMSFCGLYRKSDSNGK